MAISARDIDHLSITAPAPDELAGKLQQVGFTLTPEGVEPRCLCFQPAEDDIPNYLELIEGEERTHVWESEDGYEVDAATIVGPGGDGPLPWFPVRQEIPDAFMEPEWIVHPNGALGLTAIHAVADDPKATADALAKEWKAVMEEIFDGCAVVKTGSV